MDKVAFYKEVILKIAEEEDDKPKHSKKNNRTTFWHDRVWSGMKNGLGGVVGGVIGAKLGEGSANGYRIGTMAGSGATSAYRLTKMHNKEFGTNPDATDYAKNVVSAAIPISNWFNTPEAIVKSKLRDEQKTASIIDEIYGIEK